MKFVLFSHPIAKHFGTGHMTAHMVTTHMMTGANCAVNVRSLVSCSYVANEHYYIAQSKS